MPQGGTRGQNLGHLKIFFCFCFILLLCNQSYLKNIDYSGLTLPVTSDCRVFSFAVLSCGIIRS